MLTEMDSITFIVVSLIYIYFVIWYDQVIRRTTWYTYFKIEQSKPQPAEDLEDCQGFMISPRMEQSAETMSKEDMTFEED